MKIAIDLNDVLRDFSWNFAKYYQKNYDHTFDMSELEFWTNDLSAVFPFGTTAAYERFTYEDYAFELFGKCDACHPSLVAEFNKWVMNTVRDIDSKEPIELMIVSSMEYGSSIGASLFFLSKINCKVREIYFPSDSLTIWDKCDVLITANPRLLENKPENKKSIKIKQDYNKECDSDYEYKDLRAFIKDNTILENITNHE